jgi:hypothetical protein
VFQNLKGFLEYLMFKNETKLAVCPNKIPKYEKKNSLKHLKS